MKNAGILWVLAALAALQSSRSTGGDPRAGSEDHRLRRRTEGPRARSTGTNIRRTSRFSSTASTTWA